MAAAQLDLGGAGGDTGPGLHGNASASAVASLARAERAADTLTVGGAMPGWASKHYWFLTASFVIGGMVMSMRVFASLEKRHLAEQGYHVVLRGV